MAIAFGDCRTAEGICCSFMFTISTELYQMNNERFCGIFWLWTQLSSIQFHHSLFITKWEKDKWLHRNDRWNRNSFYGSTFFRSLYHQRAALHLRFSIFAHLNCIDVINDELMGCVVQTERKAITKNFSFYSFIFSLDSLFNALRPTINYFIFLFFSKDCGRKTRATERLNVRQIDKEN